MVSKCGKIDAFYFGVRYGAAHHFQVEHAGKGYVIDILGSAGYVAQPITTTDRLANNVQMIFCHRYSPLLPFIRCAALCTALIIGS